MAIAVDSSGSFTTAATDTFTQAFTNTAGTRIYVYAGAAGTVASPTGLTYGGVVCTPLAGLAITTGSRGRFYVLVNPPTGANNFVASYSGAGGSTRTIIAVAVTGASHHRTPLITLSNSSTTPGATYVLGQTGDTILDLLFLNQSPTATAPTADGSQTQVLSAASGNSGRGISTEAGATSVLMDWTVGGVAHEYAQLIVALVPEQVAAPQFPEIISKFASNSNAAASTHTITIPEGGITGQMYLVAFSTRASATASVTTPASGWTTVFTGQVAAVTLKQVTVFARLCDGTEGSSITVTTSEARGSEWVAALIGMPRLDLSTVGVKVGSSVVASTATPDPPSLDVTGAPDWGVSEALWIAITGWVGNVAFTSYPTGYDLGQDNSRWSNASGGGIAFACKHVEDDVVDPGTFTIASAAQTETITLAIRPLSAGVSGAIAGTSAGAATVTGTLTGTGTLAGTSAGVATVTGTLVDVVGQTALPDATISAGDWLNEVASATDLHLSVDEYPTPDDADYIESGLTSSTVRLRLSDILPPEFTP